MPQQKQNELPGINNWLAKLATQRAATLIVAALAGVALKFGWIQPDEQGDFIQRYVEPVSGWLGIGALLAVEMLQAIRHKEQLDVAAQSEPVIYPPDGSLYNARRITMRDINAGVRQRRRERRLPARAPVTNANDYEIQSTRWPVEPPEQPNENEGENL